MQCEAPNSVGGCAWLVALACLLVACVNHDERVDSICKRVKDCGGLPDQPDKRMSCSSRLQDDLDDARTTDARASACAQCVMQERNCCTALLVNRDCDKACDGVDLITAMYTRPCQRLRACRAPDRLCGIEPSRQDADCSDFECSADVVTPNPSDPCVNALEQLARNPNMDRPLSACANCLTSAVDNAQNASKPGLNTCSAATCETVCGAFDVLAQPLRLNERISTICQSMTVTCKDVTGATDRAGCLMALAHADSSGAMFEACAQCLASSRPCTDLYEQDSTQPTADGGMAPAAACSGACKPILGLIMTKKAPN